jgi:hypothetical protein
LPTLMTCGARALRVESAIDARRIDLWM